MKQKRKQLPEKQKPANGKLLQWHPAFYADLQIEFREETEKLKFEREYLLSSKPMAIDVLIIKKKDAEPIHKNIGKIFRKYNIIEYKSPSDSLSVDDFYKVYGYTNFYKADTGKVNEIPIQELTITLVSKRYPRELIRHLKEVRHYTIDNPEEGIYYVIGDILPIQILVTNRLSPEKNLWLYSLTDTLKDLSVTRKLLEDYKKNKEDQLYQAVMEIIVKANENRLKEGKRDMCNALLELMKDELDEKREEDDKVDAVKLEKVHGKIDMQNVTFSYDLNEKVLENLNINAKPNTVVAIVGPTGCGKTTIINLIMKFYNRDNGQILVDDKNIDDITKKSMRQAYAMVLQDTWLFEGSIYENIAYGNENATLEDVKRVAKLAQIDDFIEKLPNGYNTIISGNGDNISKGQKQLINIARAMLIDAKMLILDEATSNIDSKTEIQIQNALLEIMKGKTCFIIAHRLSTIKNADQILVLNNGKIVEQGKHEELLEEDGFYANLFKSQF